MVFNVQDLIAARRSLLEADVAWNDIQELAPGFKARCEIRVIEAFKLKVLDQTPISANTPDLEKLLGTNEAARTRTINALLAEDDTWTGFYEDYQSMQVAYQRARVEVQIQEDLRKAYQDRIKEAEMVMPAVLSQNLSLKNRDRVLIEYGRFMGNSVSQDDGGYIAPESDVKEMAEKILNEKAAREGQEPGLVLE